MDNMFATLSDINEKLGELVKAIGDLADVHREQLERTKETKVTVELPEAKPVEGMKWGTGE